MTVSIYTASVPLLKHMLEAMSKVLGKAAANATERKIDPQVFVTARLAPDMLALARQVQIATDMSKGGVARLAGVEIPKFEDTETTIEELQARIAKTVAFMEGVPASAIEGSNDKAISFKAGSSEMNFTGADYLLMWVIPNVMFHVTTTYDILRHNGVPVGKRDFLGSN
jgi:hypothetical protein